MILLILIPLIHLDGPHLVSIWILPENTSSVYFIYKILLSPLAEFAFLTVTTVVKHSFILVFRNDATLTSVLCLCVQNRTDARRVMQSRNPPRNCHQAFSKEGDQIFNNRSYTAEQTRANYLSGDVEEEIRCVCVCVISQDDVFWSHSVDVYLHSMPQCFIMKLLQDEFDL